MRPLLCRFLGRRQRRGDDRALAGVGEAPRHEVAGNLAVGVQRALWRLKPGAVVAIEVSAHRRIAGPLEPGRRSTRKRLSGVVTDQHRHSIWLEVDLDTRRGGAGRGPACARHRARGQHRAHDVSIQITATTGEARCRGMVPRSKISMTIMRPPQRGHGHGSALG
jgi:hypothetical protein